MARICPGNDAFPMNERKFARVPDVRPARKAPRRWPGLPARVQVRGLTTLLGATCLLTRAVFAGDPAGIYALLPSYNSRRAVELEHRAVWNNENVQGVTVRTVWPNVLSASGLLDWSFFDTAVRLGASHGKKVGLSLAAGIYTPSSVYAAGARPFAVTLAGPWQDRANTTMPEPWDPAFQRMWGKVVAALGEKYDLEPQVAYVMISGLGIEIESFYVKTPQDLVELNRLGGPDRWLQGAEAIIDLYAAAFPHKPIVLAMASPVPGPAGISWLRKLVEYGTRKYPGRLGLMYDGLDAVATNGTYQEAAVSDYSNVAPTGFQMIWSSEGAEGQQRLRGPLGEALDRGVALKAHWIEVYEADCETADHQTELSETSQELERNGAAP